MKNPLTEYVEKLNAERQKVYAMRFESETKQVLDAVISHLIVIIPALENLITWQDGAPTEDGEYLIKVPRSWGDAICYRLELVEFESGTYFRKVECQCCVNQDLPAEDIEAHARLKVG